MQAHNSRRAFIKQVALLSAAGAAGLILPGCDKPPKVVDGAPAVIKQRADQVVKFKYPDNPSFDLVYLADSLGYFDGSRTRPDYIGKIAAPQIIPLVGTGEIDFGTRMVPLVISAIASGLDLKVVAAGGKTLQEAPHMKYFVRADSGIFTPKDMEGKTVGFNSFGACAEFVTKKYLREHQVDVDKINWVVVPDNQGEQTVLSRNVDIAIIHPPASGGAEHNPELRKLWSDYDLDKGLGGMAPYSGYGQFIRENPEATEDFVAAIEAGSGADLSAFRIWYSQAGTPSLQLRDQWDGTTGTYRLTLTQHMAPTRGQPDKHPAPIPVSLALFDRHGASVDASPDTPLLESAHNVFVLDRPEAEMLWTGLSERPVLSALRGFSAPVRLHFDQPDTDLALLMRAESDAFSRWEAGQRLLHAAFSDYVQGDDARGRARLTSFCEAVAATDPSEPIVGEWLDLPATVEFTDALGAVDVDAALVADRCVRQGVADGLAEQLIAWYDAIETASPYRFDAEQAHLRRRRGACLRLMSLIDAAGAAARAETLLASADNLTDRLAALAAVNDLDDPVRAELFARFADDWGTEPLAMDKWFQLQATSVIQGQPAGIRELAARDDYDRGVPNRVRALFGSFGQRQFDGFHRMDGEGYRLLADEVLAMDALNPQVAARIVRPLTQVARILGDRSELMRRELTRIAESESLSADVREIVSAAL